MTYKRHEPSVYLVGWDGELVVKPGFSACRRWRSHEIRGATVYGVWALGLPSFDAETALHEILAESLPYAFDSKDEAQHILMSGDGWAECRRAADEAAYREALNSCDAYMRRIHASHTSKSDASHDAVGDATNGRTDERDVDITHLSSKSSASVRARSKAMSMSEVIS